MPDDLRFIDRIELFQPQVELLVRTRLTLERDRYLGDHVFRGSHLFPTVFGLEAMAQAVILVTGEPARSICRIENIGLDRPIVVDPEHGLEIEIYALAEEGARSGERAIRVGIRTEQTGFAADHFSATFVLGTRQEGEIVPLALESLKRPPLKLDPSTQLYGSILFQGPLFQRIGPVYELDEHHVVFESSVIEPPAPYPEIFGEDAVGRIILGDPFLRDTLLQSLQLVVPQEVCLPIRIERLELYNTADTRSSKRIVVLPSKARWGQEYQTEVLVTDEQGRILECMEGYWLRIMEEHPEYPTSTELANASPEDMGSREIYRLDPNTHIARVSHDGPQGQPVFEFSQLVSFHNSSALSRHVPLSKYAWWMGKMCETVLAAGVPHIAGKIATGKWGMVTNWTELRVLGEITANDVVLMRFWGTRPKGSEFHYCCDFWKISGEKKERVAFSEQKATWVRLTGHGQVSVEP
ncbi:MAG: polyketide synthase dehydratase domain-containing protein, partial [Pseudomonadota bacterium]|nr:polyketide synthase dehydratase domain-containing protein [Pseudomonadota bacterium]